VCLDQVNNGYKEVFVVVYVCQAVEVHFLKAFLFLSNFLEMAAATLNFTFLVTNSILRLSSKLSSVYQSWRQRESSQQI
jgi:hypothetical protein